MQQVLVQTEPRGPSVLIEVNVPNNAAQRIAFPDIAQLRSTTSSKIILKGLRLITSEILPAGILSNFTTAPPAELAKMAITLYAEGWEKGQSIPVLTLNDMVFTTGALPYRFNSTRFDNWINVDWAKSYIQYANGNTSAGAPYVVMFDCEYLRLDANGNVIEGPSR